jgi:hypothetical protein
MGVVSNSVPSCAHLSMADLEKLAMRRDRGYLVRLAVFLAAGLVGAVFMYGFLTGATVTGCVAGALGAHPQGAHDKHSKMPSR